MTFQKGKFCLLSFSFSTSICLEKWKKKVVEKEIFYSFIQFRFFHSTHFLLSVSFCSQFEDVILPFILPAHQDYHHHNLDHHYHLFFFDSKNVFILYKKISCSLWKQTFLLNDSIHTWFWSMYVYIVYIIFIAKFGLRLGQ